VASKILEKELSVRQTEELVGGRIDPALAELAKKLEEQIVDPNVREAERTLERVLGVRVTIKDRNGKGKILLEYKSLEDFDRVLEMLQGK
jgi:ParB family chromosome partitioning protein